MTAFKGIGARLFSAAAALTVTAASVVCMSGITDVSAQTNEKEKKDSHPLGGTS